MSEHGLDLHRAGSGEPLVLIHGIGSTWRAWNPVLSRLEGRHDVLAIDLPGFGRSDPLPPGTPPTPEALTDAVEGEMDRAGFQTAHIAGNSLGGRVAAELARRGRARSAVLLSPAGLFTDREGAYAERMLMVTWNMSRSGIDPGLLLRPLPTRVLLGSLMYGKPWRADPDELIEQSGLLAGGPGFLATLETLHGRQPPGLDTIDVPVLVAWGTRDRLLPPRQAPRWERLIPGAELRYLPGLGHVPMSDDPEVVAGVISDFAARCSRRREAAPA